MEKIFYVPVPEDEFYERIGEAVYSIFKKKSFSVSNTKDESKWLNHEEAAAYLKKTPATLYKLSSNREVKFSKRGKSNFYRVEDLDKYMYEGLVKTTNEIVKEVCLTPKKKYSLTKT